ncbi:MAG: hypothetical protein E6392_12360, partial [Staphylococcus epidermidis]|nr:hypothetical protein [Staphylococcus epidermidis]
LLSYKFKIDIVYFKYHIFLYNYFDFSKILPIFIKKLEIPSIITLNHNMNSLILNYIAVDNK